MIARRDRYTTTATSAIELWDFRRSADAATSRTFPWLRSVGLLLTFPLSVASLAQQAVSRIVVPIEVMGEDGAISSAAFEIAPEKGKLARYLSLQVHGLEYAEMASIQINQGAWMALSNRTADIAEPGKSYGGIGGGFATLQLTMALSTGDVRDGSNSIHFRFNHSNGVSDGFRVLTFNLLTAHRQPILPSDFFVQDDPNGWVSPLPGRQNVADGERWWNTATLKASSQAGARPLRAHCSDCHSRDGRDLKYFNYSNHSIVARSCFHGLTALQGEQIASYIRSLPFPNPGRPWNPPYQPGPGLTRRPAADWASGAGLEWVLADDSQTLGYVFPGKGGGLSITTKTFAPDGDLPQRDIPIAMQLPDWNHWLPQVHPLDAWGDRFAASEFASLYERSKYSQTESQQGFRDFFDAWLRSRKHFLTPPPATSKKWTAEMATAMYSTLLWQLVKTWELTQQFSLEASGAAPDPLMPARTSWLNTIPEATAPASVNIPDGPAGMGGSALTNEFFNNAWYELQLLLNDGDHQHHGRTPIDWVYIAGHIRELENAGGKPEPGRLIVLTIKSMQSSNPGLGPQDPSEGWRPDRNIDPRMMVAAGWRTTFGSLPAEERQAMMQSWLTAWLDKSSSYPTASYFFRGQLPDSYVPPKDLRDVWGGRVWEDAGQFRQAGVDPAVIHRLEAWGSVYMEAAGLFHY